jgi:phage gpG-like protein
MFRFRLELAGEVAMDRGIARFADGVADYRPVWPVIEDDFYAQIKDQFKTEGAEGGEKWAPLSPEYAGYKEAHFPGKPILQRTGDLYESLTNPNSANGVRKEERKTLTLGSTIPYAVFHQLGTENMPARPEVVLPEALKRSIMHHVQVYLVQIASQSGFRTSGWSPLSVMSKAASGARSRPAGSTRGFGRRRK